jgi:hypothetical protein|tara:strand:+ start:441 stop:638 length:198 start_codon:yes stop_codon:yes gene_type:complete
MLLRWLKKIFTKGNIMEDDIKHQDLENLDDNLEVEDTEETVEEVVEEAPKSGEMVFRKGKWRRVN